MNWRDLLFTIMFQFIRVSRVDRLLLYGGSYPIGEYFRGIENVAAVRRIFGEGAPEVLRDFQVRFTWMGGYMRVDPFRRSIVVSSKYLANGDRTDIYLDLIHELVHVRQLIEGKELYDVHYGYAERPTEIEAYRIAVEEARRMGLSDDRICRYLETEWMSDEDVQRLAQVVGVACK